MSDALRPTAADNAPRAASPPVPVSVIILTFNEECNIAECIRSCDWCDDVHVVDSGSTDQTRQIAQEMGARVWLNPFVSFGQQRNWTIDQIPTRHRWHFHLDADERITPALVREMGHTLGPDSMRSRMAAYLVPSKMIFMGKWLRHSGGYPAYQVRLLHIDRCRFVDFGHGQREVTTGQVGTLANPYIHYNFSKGLVEWFSKHNSYSDQESAEGIAVRHARRPVLPDLRSRDPVVRRRAIKNLSFRVSGRGLWRFFDMFIRRGGWRDGTPGFHYCAMISMYEHWTDLKMRERQSRWPEQTDRLADALGQEPAA
ncbi:MAG: glycosyltransferase family 2 protein [Tepidisphaeraceae bacterium]